MVTFYFIDIFIFLKIFNYCNSIVLKMVTKNGEKKREKNGEKSSDLKKT